MDVLSRQGAEQGDDTGLRFQLMAHDGAARLGRLRTRQGWLSTPFFMPVVTRLGENLTIGPSDYYSLGADAAVCAGVNQQTLIANSLIAYFDPGLEVIRDAGGLRDYLGLQGNLFTDSGGFQTSDLSPIVAKVTAGGIHFSDPHSGSEILLTPALSMQIQASLGSDVAMVIDDMTSPDTDRTKALEAMHRTHRWAFECLEARTDCEQLLFGIAHGGAFEDLRTQSAEETSAMGFDGVAIGGIALHHDSVKRCALVAAAIQAIGQQQPRYVMGIGDPIGILDLVMLGVDCFDAAYPTIQARRHILLTDCGPLDLTQLCASEQGVPVDRHCRCASCQGYTLTDPVLLMDAEPERVQRAAAIHNLAFMQRFMRDLRTSVRAGRLRNFSDIFKSAWLRQKR